jgi:hypothetical protein
VSRCARKGAGRASVAVLLTVKVSRAAGETQWEAVVGECPPSSVATHDGLGTRSGLRPRLRAPTAGLRNSSQPFSAPPALAATTASSLALLILRLRSPVSR